MKKLILIGAVVTLFFATGCLKDKDYEDGNYGIQNTEVKGIAFNRTTFAASLAAENTPQTDSSIFIVVNANFAPSADVSYTLISDSSLVRPFNPALVPLKPSEYTFNATGVIPAGKYNKAIAITLTNPSLLDPNIQYGVALKITSAGDGYKVASNSNVIVVTFSIKNKYDGRYSLSGVHNRSPNNFPYSGVRIDLVTTGPASVAYYNVGRSEFSNVLSTGPGTIGSYGTAIGPNFTFNPATNNVVSISNQGGPAVGLFLGPNPGKWDPVTKTITVQYFYTTGANQDFSNRGWSDTLRYLGPR